MNKLTIELHLDNDAYTLEDGTIDYQAIQDQLILVSQDIGDGNTNINIKDYLKYGFKKHFLDTTNMSNYRWYHTVYMYNYDFHLNISIRVFYVMSSP